MLLYLTVSEPILLIVTVIILNLSTTIIYTMAHPSMLSLLSSSISSSSPPSSPSPSPSSSTSSSSSSPVDDDTRHLLLPLADHCQEVPLPLVADAHLFKKDMLHFVFHFLDDSIMNLAKFFLLVFLCCDFFCAKSFLFFFYLSLVADTHLFLETKSFFIFAFVFFVSISCRVVY